MSFFGSKHLVFYKKLDAVTSQRSKIIEEQVMVTWG